MTVSIADCLKSWELEYRQKGGIWRGAPADLPYIPPNSKVLELGCGNGKTLSAMAKRPWRTTALDFSPEAVRLARAVAEPKIDLLVGEASNLPFGEEEFDAVFAFHIVGHATSTHRKRMAAEATRVLRMGKVLFFRDFGAEDMRAGNGREDEPFTFRRGNGVVTHYFTEDEVIELFSDLSPIFVKTDLRTTRIKGQDLIRSEVVAAFVKKGDKEEIDAEQDAIIRR